MKLVFISDTHGYHERLELPEGNIIIHAGDLSKKGTGEEFIEFIKWFENLNYEHKIFIAGNHDFFLEREAIEIIIGHIPKSITYLNDSGVEINGIKFWGSPIQPWFFDFAFNRQRGSDIARHWALIPNDTDVLITHGPPKGILDKTLRNESVGCKDLKNRIEELNIKIHAFGHIHEAYGIKKENAIQYVNASVVDFNYKLANNPIVIELPIN